MEDLESKEIQEPKNEKENSIQNPKVKRERKKSAQPLPASLKQYMMKKYVVYYHEYLNPEKTRSREFFKVEKHPAQKKIWIGSKSNKVTILEKLKTANEIVTQLDIKLKKTLEDNNDDKDNETPEIIQSII
jgi:hypothetical protein